MPQTVPLELLTQNSEAGVEQWNRWRAENPHVRPNLHRAHLPQAFLQFADLHGADLSDAFLRMAHLYGADLSGANLRGAILVGATLSKADLTGSDLTEANLAQCSMNEGTIVQDAILRKCKVYGISAWALVGEPAEQADLVITLDDEPTLAVDDVETAQFMYLLLNNKKIRNLIDTVTSKVVLILGRFSDERKPVLDAMREELRQRGLAPVLFDFDKPASKDVTGTVETLARMARFIIADLTDPSSIPHELATIVPFLRTTPVLPLRLAGSGGYGMFDDLKRAYTWVLDTYEYGDMASLLSALPQVIAPANEMADRLRKLP